MVQGNIQKLIEAVQCSQTVRACAGQRVFSAPLVRLKTSASVVVMRPNLPVSVRSLEQSG